MGLFHRIEGAKAILRSKGVFKQVDVFQRDGRIYAQHGTGYVGLKSDEGATTAPRLFWEHLEGVDYAVGKWYNLMIADAQEQKEAT
jgi:hypothetical protein